MLVGRERERAVIDGLLRGAREGRSGALVLRGEAGIGKTALLRYAVERAEGLRVLRAVGVESEAELPFAGVHELVRPCLARLDALPPASAAALRGALALGPPAPADRFAAYVGLLALLTAVAGERPLLCVVDDAHWLDGSSADALGFACRRLDADAVAVLLSVRSGEQRAFAAPGIDELVVGGLDPGAARELLASGGADVSDATARRLVALTGGNPLALAEVPRLLSAAQLAGSEPLPEPLPLGEALKDAFARRLEALPQAARASLVVAAASDSGALDEIAAATTRLGGDVQALQAAEAAGLVAFGPGELRFMHPLARSAAYHSADPADRRAAHAALAAAIGDETARGAWHLAAATLAPDERVAAALDAAATAAAARGGFTAAASARERAAALTPDPEERARRMLAAANELWLAGRSERAAALAQGVIAATHDPLLRADAHAVHARVSMWRADVLEAHAELVRAADEVAPLDPERASLLLAEASAPAFMAGRVGTALETAARAVAISDGRGPGGALAVAMLGEARIAVGDASGRELIAATAAALDDAPPEFLPLIAGPVGICLAWIEDFDAARAALERVIGMARTLGAITALPYSLAVLAEVDFRTGRLRAAFAGASESVELARETGLTSGTSYSLVTLARSEAVLGREADARRHAAEALELVETNSVGSILSYAGSVLGLLELGIGRPHEAVAHLEPVALGFAVEHGVREPGVVQWAPDLIEAYARAGRREDAERALSDLEELADATGRVWAHATAARCRGMLAAPEAMDAAFARALDWHARTPTPFERARTELCWGERLRRAGRTAEARVRLRSALASFGAAGAAPWAEHARAELAATGARTAPSPGGAAELTPQELRVALLAAEGATNREIAAALFLSEKTVEYHLRKVFVKLRLRSRTELARRMAGGRTGT